MQQAEQAALGAVAAGSLVAWAADLEGVAVRVGVQRAEAAVTMAALVAAAATTVAMASAAVMGAVATVMVLQAVVARVAVVGQAELMVAEAEVVQAAEQVAQVAWLALAVDSTEAGRVAVAKERAAMEAEA